MDYAKLLERCCRIDDKHSGAAESFVNSARKIIDENDVNYLSVESAFRFLYVEGTCGRTSLYLRKKYLRILYDILVENGALSEESAASVLSAIKTREITTDEYVERFMFKDLGAALSQISAIGASAIGEEDMLFEKSLVILLWHGVEINDIAQIRKYDLCEDPYGVIVRGKFIELRKEYFDVLDKYASIATYRAYPNGKCYELVESPWLFRSWKKQQLDTNNIRTRLKQFNQSKCVIISGKTFGVNDLKKNGRFYQIYMKQTKFANKFERNNKIGEYEKWVDYFWSERKV